MRFENRHQVLTFLGPRGVSAQELRFVVPLPIKNLLRHALRFSEDGIAIEFPDHIREIPAPEEVREVLRESSIMARADLRNEMAAFLTLPDDASRQKVICYHTVTNEAFTIKNLRSKVLGFAISPDARWVGLVYAGPRITRRVQRFYSPLLSAMLTRCLRVFADGNLLFAQGGALARGPIFRAERKANRLKLTRISQLPVRQATNSVMNVVGDSEKACYPIVDGLRDYVDMHGTEVIQNWPGRPTIAQSPCAVKTHWYTIPNCLKRRSIMASPDGSGVIFFSNGRVFYLPQFDQISYEYDPHWHKHSGVNAIFCRDKKQYNLMRGAGILRRRLDTGLARDMTAANYLDRNFLFTEVAEENSLHLVAGQYLLQRTSGSPDHWSTAPSAGKPAPLSGLEGSWGVILPRYLHHQFARYAQLNTQIERHSLIRETHAALHHYISDIEYCVLVPAEAAEARKIVREFERFARENGFSLEDPKKILLRPSEARAASANDLLRPVQGISSADPNQLLRATDEAFSDSPAEDGETIGAPRRSMK